MTARTLLFVLALVGFTPGSNVHASAIKAQVDSSYAVRVDLARDWIRKFGFDQKINAEMRSQSTRLFDRPKAKLPETDRIMKQLRGFVIEEFEHSATIFMDTLAAVLANILTVEELRETLTWDPKKEPKGPVFRKFQQVVLPQIQTTFSSGLGQQIGSNALTNAINRLDEHDRTRVRAIFESRSR